MKKGVPDDKLFAKVQQIIEVQLGIDSAEITPSADLVNDLGADSLDIVELVMAFEEAFDIEISDDDEEEIKTVQNAVDYLRNAPKVAHRER